MNQYTTVVVRRFKDNGQLIALFPCEVGTNNPHTCMSYMTLGQHGSASASLASDKKPQQTIPAVGEDVDCFLQELKRAGYSFENVLRSVTYEHHFNIRKSELLRLYFVDVAMQNTDSEKWEEVKSMSVHNLVSLLLQIGVQPMVRIHSLGEVRVIAATDTKLTIKAIAQEWTLPISRATPVD